MLIMLRIRQDIN